MPEAKPYPGCHRIHGVEVVPVSVLLQTISVAAAESGVAAVSAVRFEHPIVVDQPRVIQVVADAESVTVSSRLAADAPPYRWVKHVSARLPSLPFSPGALDADVCVTYDGQDEITSRESLSVDELLEAWGVEGQPFAWSIEALRPTPGGLVADVGLTEASTRTAQRAVHVARLVDGSNPRLTVPAGVESVRRRTALTDPQGPVEIRRQPGNADEIVVHIAVKAPDGTTCVDIRSLRYADLDSSPEQAPARAADPRSFARATSGDPGPRTVTSWRRRRTHARWPLSAVRAVPATISRAGSQPPGTHRTGWPRRGMCADLAEPQAGEADIDGAVRSSTEVGDLVRLLADPDDQHPATLWIITRSVREADSDEALPQSCLWGLARVIAAEQPDLWGGLVDIPGGDDFGACVAALSTVLPTAAKSVLVLRNGEFFTPALVLVSGQPVREPLRCRPDAAYPASPAAWAHSVY